MDEAPLIAKGDLWFPDWLGPSDHVWLDALLDEARRSVGMTVREWQVRAREPLRVPAPQRRLGAAVSVLDDLLETARPEGSPVLLRSRLFHASQRARTDGDFSRSELLASVADELGLEPGWCERNLFADLPAERRLAPVDLPDPQDLALRTNLAIAQRILRGATEVEVWVTGSARAVLRQLMLRRLLLVARPREGGVHLRISGPVSLFRHTTRYGRALASVVPVLRGADRFVLTAKQLRRGRPTPVRIASGDPVFPVAPPPRFDSALEERFCRDFLRVATDWDLVREPEPIEVDRSFVFPDFLVVHRRDTSRRWLLEIVGFWTPEYLDGKLERLARAGRTDLIVCVDMTRGDPRPWGRAGKVVPFTRRIDPLAVLALLEPPTPMIEVRAPPTGAPEKVP